MKNRVLSFLAMLLLGLLVAAGSTFAQKKDSVKTEKSLYDRLGGSHAIAAAVDDIVERTWVNEVLNANPKNKQAMGIKKPALKYLVTE